MAQFGAFQVLTDQQGVSLDTLATDLGLPASQVAPWLIGLALVPEALVAAVAAALGVPRPWSGTTAAPHTPSPPQSSRRTRSACVSQWIDAWLPGLSDVRWVRGGMW